MILVVWILPMGDQWLLPLQHLLKRRDKGETLFLRLLIRLTDNPRSSSSTLSLQGRSSRIIPLPRPFPFRLVLRLTVSSPLLLNLARAGVEPRSYECCLPGVVSDSLKSTLLSNLLITGSVPPTLLSPVPSAVPPSRS